MRSSAAGAGRFVAAILITLVVVAAPASAQGCPHAVIFTLPGVTWADVKEFSPPNLLSLVDEGAAGSVSVRTNSSRTSYASGFATIGAGARLDGGRTGIAATDEVDEVDEALEPAAAPGIDEIRALAEEAGYGAQPGALATALEVPVFAIGNADLGDAPPTPVGFGRWVLLAVMDSSGRVDAAATGPGLIADAPAAPFGVATDPRAITTLVDTALDASCSVGIVDHGDMIRADAASTAAGHELGDARRAALLAADDLLGSIAAILDPQRDLLLVVTPTSPAWEDEAHLGIAVARGPGFEAGSGLESASTRRPGIVTLPDVAPTVLAHLGVERPAAMSGRPWISVDAKTDRRIADAVALDDDSVFVDALRGPVSTAYVVVQVLIYLAGVLMLRRGLGPVSAGRRDLLANLALLVVAFLPATYLVGVIPAHGIGAIPYVLVIIGVAVALVAVVSIWLEVALDRLLAVSAVTVAILGLDLVVGGPLQMNTVLGYSPIVAGRFAGIGNIAFAVLGATALLSGALVSNRWPHARAASIGVPVLFVLVVVVDGAPSLGSDVGGVLSLVPALGITLVLLSGKRPGATAIAGTIGAAVAFVALFLVFDLTRPPSSQTHLARLFQDLRERGVGFLEDVVERKARANLRVFTSTIWTYFVPPALAAAAYLLARPRGRWRHLAGTHPRLRAGLVGALVLALVGGALNDSGIVIPAVVLSVMVPTALLVHLSIEGSGPGGDVAGKAPG